MNMIVRPILALTLALSMGFGAVALTGCGSSGASSAAASSASASAASDNSAASGSSAADEQDDCYGEDLPATKSDKS